MPNVFTPRKTKVTVTRRDPHPVSQYMASALGALYIRGINGNTGAFRYGTPSLSTQMTNFKGYTNPPQMFLGWNPKRVAGGAVRYTPQRLPAGAPSDPGDNPLQNAITTISAGAGLVY